jgi:hypothetical protein
MLVTCVTDTQAALVLADGSVLVLAALAGPECATAMEAHQDGAAVVERGGHFYVPVDWLLQMRSDLQGLPEPVRDAAWQWVRDQARRVSSPPPCR